MALRHQGELGKHAQPGDILLVVHEFVARSPDELSLAKGDRIELIERDDDFGDGWYLGRHLQNGNTGLFPEVYTTVAPKSTPTAPSKSKTQGALAPPASVASNAATEKAEIDEKTPSATEANSTSYFAQNPTSASTPVPPSREITASPAIPAAAAATTAAAPTMAAAAPTTATTTTAPSLSVAAAARDIPEATPSVPTGSPQPTSTVMNETLSVIDEHITNMNKPSRLDPNPSPMLDSVPRRPSLVSHDSGSQYSNNASQTRLAYVAGEETEDEEDGRLTEAEVSQWSPAVVADYLEGAGVEKSHCDLFREEEFTGEVILQMEQSQVFMKEFDLGPIGRRMRTWQKIKALQDEVHSSKTPSVRSPHGSTSQGQRPRRVTSPGMGNTPPISGQTSPRPSAASIRSIGHRRHSSTEQNVAPGFRSSQPPADKPPRTKQSSFDRGWTMGGGPAVGGLAPSTTYGNGSRQISTNHLHTASADRGAFGKTSQGSSQVSLQTPIDMDKGYISGGEGDSTRRNVIRKRDPSGDHSRTASYSSEKRKSANFFWQRKPPDSPVKEVNDSYGNSNMAYGDGVRVVSEPIQGNQTSPTVTRLEYDNDLPRSNRDSATKVSPIENQRASTNSETVQGAARRGFRTISDAITGREKSLVTSSDRVLPSDTSITDSPDRTSSAASGTIPVFDYEDANRSEFATSGQGLTTSGTRRKSKKATSAYIRGLEKKSPQEQMLGCDHSGWMKKKSSNLMTTWKPRFFVLRGRRLSYYYSDNDTEEKGLIDISNHRVLPADSDFITSMHAALTGGGKNASPTSPQQGTVPDTPSTTYSDGGPPSATTSTASTLASPVVPPDNSDSPGAGQSFLFKLVPPRTGLSKGVNFTRPSVHYFAVPNRQEGRAWMAALMKATIDRDETMKVITTYQQKTITLEQARARKERPPFLMGLGEEDEKDTTAGAQEKSLGGDSAVAENGSMVPDTERTVDDKTDLPPIDTDVVGNNGQESSQTPNSGLGIQGLSGGSGKDPTGSTIKSSGLWS